MFLIKRLLTVSFIIALASCSLAYRIDLQQGNVVTQEMLDQLQLGMDKRKVRFIMGTPLVQDMFHADRWDFVYRMDRRRAELEQRHVVLFFKEGVLTDVQGDVAALPPSKSPPPPASMDGAEPLL